MMDNALYNHDSAGLCDAFLQDIDGDWTFDFQDLNGVSYDLDIDNQTIILHNYGLKPDHLFSSTYFKPQVMLAMIESLRMVRHVEWLDGMLDRYHPETIMMIGRLCVADTQTHKIKTAWDHKIHGDDSLWKHLLCGETSDMAVTYERVLEKYMAGGYDASMAIMKSMAAIFNQWFSCPDRMRDCDHDTLNLIDDLLEQGAKLGHKRLEKNTLTCLTLMAGGEFGTYIDRHLNQDILHNPYYAAMNDTINQVHFNQIVTDMTAICVDGVMFQDPSLAARFGDI